MDPVNQVTLSVNRRKASRRLTGSVSAFVCAAVMLVAPTASHAFTDTYCGIVRTPGGPGCNSTWPHSFQESHAYYTGLPQHHVKPCTYLANTVNGQIRGGQISCRWSENGLAVVTFGPTYALQYRGEAYLHPDTCCNHTIAAWAETTLP